MNSFIRLKLYKHTKKWDGINKNKCISKENKPSKPQ